MWLLFCLASGITAALLGRLFFNWFENWLRTQSGLKRPEPDVARVPADVTGAIEQFVFGSIFPIMPEAAGAGALVWLGFKQLPFWQAPSPRRDDEHGYRGFQSLLMGFVSLAFAGAVGLVFRWLLQNAGHI